MCWDLKLCKGINLSSHFLLTNEALLGFSWKSWNWKRWQSACHTQKMRISWASHFPQIRAACCKCLVPKYNERIQMMFMCDANSLQGLACKGNPELNGKLGWVRLAHIWWHHFLISNYLAFYVLVSSRGVATGGATGAAAPPIFWMGGRNSYVIALMTSSLLKNGPTNIFTLLPPCLWQFVFAIFNDSESPFHPT